MIDNINLTYSNNKQTDKMVDESNASKISSHDSRIIDLKFAELLSPNESELSHGNIKIEKKYLHMK